MVLQRGQSDVGGGCLIKTSFFYFPFRIFFPSGKKIPGLGHIQKKLRLFFSSSVSFFLAERRYLVSGIFKKTSSFYLPFLFRIFFPDGKKILGLGYIQKKLRLFLLFRSTFVSLQIVLAKSDRLITV